jgi:hypothetical protein
MSTRTDIHYTRSGQSESFTRITTAEKNRLRIRITLTRLRIQLFYFNADPDPTFLLNADPDLNPALFQLACESESSTQALKNASKTKEFEQRNVRFAE